jgi:beta-glucosidase
MLRHHHRLLAAACAAALCAPAAAAPAAKAPWMDAKLSPDRRAELVLAQMTLDEQIALLHGDFPIFMKSRPKDVQISAGYVPGVPRLSVPPLYESDASLGVANARRGPKDDATALPSGLGLAATWDEQAAFASGAMIGKEARQKGFNVLLAGGTNLIREPRNGRNFEYLSEDPLLSGRIAGASIRGIQSNHIISTTKHYLANDQETGRMVASVEMDPAALRESDLLAFEIAIEAGKPGSVMCSYNRIGGTYACEHPAMLNGVLKGDWGWKGFVMSDWGAVHSLDAAVAGLDQQSGQQLDKQVFFDAPLKAAAQSGKIPMARVHDMTRRVLRSMFADGLFDDPIAPGGLDTTADGVVAQHAAEGGIVLLKNDRGVLPLAASARKIVVIGGRADVGVISGGGSSQVMPVGSKTFPAPKGAPSWGGGVVFHPSAPLAAIRGRAKGEVTFLDGSDPAAAVAAAKGADVVLVFADQWASEGMDVSLTLSDNQDALIAAVAAANPRTVVVLQTGAPVLMPWAGSVPAIVEAWFPGSRGGEAIARVLFGETDAQGRLPVSFPASLSQLPRPELPGAKNFVVEGLTNTPPTKPFDIRYDEGSDVGYRWFAKTGQAPLFPFGHGLSYTTFRYSGLKVAGGKALSASFTVTNTGPRAGVDTPQVYLTDAPRRRQQRLIGWSKVALKPGERRIVTVTADPRLTASWNEAGHGWRVAAGTYRVFVGADAASPSLKGEAKLVAAKLKP